MGEASRVEQAETWEGVRQTTWETLKEESEEAVNPEDDNDGEVYLLQHNQERTRRRGKAASSSSRFKEKGMVKGRPVEVEAERALRRIPA